METSNAEGDYISPSASANIKIRSFWRALKTRGSRGWLQCHGNYLHFESKLWVPTPERFLQLPIQLGGQLYDNLLAPLTARPTTSLRSLISRSCSVHVKKLCRM